MDQFELCYVEDIVVTKTNKILKYCTTTLLIYLSYK